MYLNDNLNYNVLPAPVNDLNKYADVCAVEILNNTSANIIAIQVY